MGGKVYTASAVAEKAHCKQASVRYFARKNSIPKIIVGNKAVFIFDKKDYKRFLAYLKGGNPLEQRDKKQLVFSFYYRSNFEKVKKKEKQDERKIIKKLCRLLQEAKEKGVKRAVICKKLGIDESALERILLKTVSLPIGEDFEADDRLYWVGR